MTVQNFSYLLGLLVLFLLAFFLKFRFKISLFENKKQIFVFWAVMYAIGIVLDSKAISQGAWSFSPKSTLGLRLGNMPVEEYLFIFVLGFLGLTVYKTVVKKVK